MFTVSIVLFKTDLNQLIRCIESVQKSITSTIFIIDNSPNNELGTVEALFENIVYIFNPTNPGYGAAHNIALKRALDMGGRYHLVLNADIYFGPETLQTLVNYMDENVDVGLVMPKVLYPNGEVQYLCKLLPTPFDLISRIFLPNKLQIKNNFKFEMRSTGYSNEMFVPFLSGCFMFLRVDVLKKCGMFDEDFFMYAEDMDLTRRVAAEYKTMYYPGATIYHEHAAASKKSIIMFLIHVNNVIRYFNKWGWFFDLGRRELNKLALAMACTK